MKQPKSKLITCWLTKALEKRDICKDYPKNKLNNKYDTSAATSFIKYPNLFNKRNFIKQMFINLLFLLSDMDEQRLFFSKY